MHRLRLDEFCAFARIAVLLTSKTHMELSQQYFDRQMSKLATSEELKQLQSTINTLRVTVDQHTSVLDGIAKDVKDWNTEIVAVRARLDRHDQWFKQLADHLNVKLQS